MCSFEPLNWKLCDVSRTGAFVFISSFRSLHFSATFDTTIKLPRAGDALLLVDCVYNFVAMFVCHFVSLERGDNTLQNRREVDLGSCQKFTTWQNHTMEQDSGFSVPINNHCLGVFYA